MMQALCITLQVQAICLALDKQHFRDKPFAQRGLPVQNLRFFPINALIGVMDNWIRFQ